MNALNGGPASRPSRRRVRSSAASAARRPSCRRRHSRPPCPHRALWPAWFRELGTPEEPGSALVTFSAPSATPESTRWSWARHYGPRSTRRAEPTSRSRRCGRRYFGTWIGETTSISSGSSTQTSPLGASLGARALVALPASACGVYETARAARYLAAESAGHADRVSTVSRRSPTCSSRSPPAGRMRAARDCRAGSPMSRPRRLPTPGRRGPVLASAMSVFADEFEAHSATARCPPGPPSLPLSHVPAAA